LLLFRLIRSGPGIEKRKQFQRDKQFWGKQGKTYLEVFVHALYKYACKGRCKMKIEQKLILGYIGIVLLVGGVGGIAVNYTTKIRKNVDETILSNVVEVEGASVISYKVQQISSSIRELFLGTIEERPGKIKKAKKRIKKSISVSQKFIFLWEDAIETGLRLSGEKEEDDEKLKEMKILNENLHNFIVLVKKTIGLLEESGYETAKEFFEDKTEPLSRKIQYIAKRLEKDIEKEMITDMEEIRTIAKNTMMFSVIATIIALLITIAIRFFISKSIITPITKLRDATVEIGKGKLDAQIIEVTSNDEIGELAASFKKMTEDLKRTTTSIDNLNMEITKRVQAEEKLKSYFDELERSNKELQQFAYIASHDLQEPLRMVASYTQLLAMRYKGKLDSDADEFIAFAVDGANRMQALINDLLAYSRVGTKGKEFQPTDCQTVLDNITRNLQKIIEESSAEITHDPLPTVVGDDIQLGQLFQNFIVNAIKFQSDSYPRIHISAEKNEKEWIFSVKDDGIGIDPEFKERIFEIFQRLHARGEYPGTGIGLAICKKIVERHGGRVWVESEPGKGSTFYFSISMKGEN
jgi:signal transduction histidine kinase